MRTDIERCVNSIAAISSVDRVENKSAVWKKRANSHAYDGQRSMPLLFRVNFVIHTPERGQKTAQYTKRAGKKWIRRVPRSRRSIRCIMAERMRRNKNDPAIKCVSIVYKQCWNWHAKLLDLGEFAVLRMQRNFGFILLNDFLDQFCIIATIFVNELSRNRRNDESVRGNLQACAKKSHMPIYGNANSYWKKAHRKCVKIVKHVQSICANKKCKQKVGIYRKQHFQNFQNIEFAICLRICTSQSAAGHNKSMRHSKCMKITVAGKLFRKLSHGYVRITQSSQEQSRLHKKIMKSPKGFSIVRVDQLRIRLIYERQR